MTTRTEGQWTFQITFSGTTAAHSDGTVIEALDMVAARRKVYEHERTQQSVVTYTLAGGPQRARVGHQRYTQAHMEAA